jgi:hypothetical protein
VNDFHARQRDLVRGEAGTMVHHHQELMSHGTQHRAGPNPDSECLRAEAFASKQPQLPTHST